MNRKILLVILPALLAGGCTADQLKKGNETLLAVREAMTSIRMAQQQNTDDIIALASELDDGKDPAKITEILGRLLVRNESLDDPAMISEMTANVLAAIEEGRDWRDWFSEYAGTAAAAGGLGWLGMAIAILSKMRKAG